MGKWNSCCTRLFTRNFHMGFYWFPLPIDSTHLNRIYIFTVGTWNQIQQLSWFYGFIVCEIKRNGVRFENSTVKYKWHRAYKDDNG